MSDGRGSTLRFLRYLLFNMLRFAIALEKGFDQRHDAFVGIFNHVMAAVAQAMYFGVRQMAIRQGMNGGGKAPVLNKMIRANRCFRRCTAPRPIAPPQS